MKKIFVFDLDFTLWDAGGTWYDTINPPYFREYEKLLDQSWNWIRFYSDVIHILNLLKENKKYIVAAFRTFEPEWAQDLLHQLDIDKYFDLKEIYPASKIQHLKRIQNYFNLIFSRMLLFDDKYNIIEEFSGLGVETVFVKKGINQKKSKCISIILEIITFKKKI